MQMSHDVTVLEFALDLSFIICKRQNNSDYMRNKKGNNDKALDIMQDLYKHSITVAYDYPHFICKETGLITYPTHESTFE